MNVEPLCRLADLIAEPGELPEVYAAAVDAVKHLLGADRAAILLWRDDGRVEVGAWDALSADYRGRAAIAYPWPAATSAPEVRVIADVLAEADQEDMREALVREGIRAVAFVPLLSRAAFRGALAAYFDGPRRLTPAEIRLAEALAHHVALALDRARTSGGHSTVRTDLLSSLSHSLRNPMNAIVTAAQVIETPAASEALKTMAHGILRREIAYMGRVLDHLLDENRLRRGLVELRREPIDLRATVQLAVEELSAECAGKSQEVDLALPAEPVTLIGDPDRLRQVVSHLLDNAIRLTPARGAIRVALTAAEQSATLCVADSGRGIARERLDTIFEPFGGDAGESARRGRGLGLGLSLVKRIVELHGGSVRAESGGPDAGASFIVSLPLAPPDHPSSARDRG